MHTQNTDLPLNLDSGGDNFTAVFLARFIIFYSIKTVNNCPFKQKA